MKLRSYKYLLGEGFRNTWANRLMTISSIGVLVACMVIIGLAILISKNVDKEMGNLQKQNVVVAFLKDENWAIYSDKEETLNTESGEETTEDIKNVPYDSYLIHNEAEAEEIRVEIEALSNVEKAVYVSAEEGLKKSTYNMTDTQKEYFDFLNEDKENPISCAIEVTMKDMAYFDETVDKIESIDAVVSVRSQGDLADKINAIEKGLGLAGIWIIAILIIISLVIVSNTIRVTMYTRKLEIGIMKAVGATDSFVRIPFIVEGMLIGLISAVLAEGLVYFCYRIASETLIKSIASSGLVGFSQMALPLFIVFVAIGVIAGAIGSFIMISKYLRREGSEFTAI